MNCELKWQTVNSCTVQADLFVLPLCGIDIVLGVNWLRTLDPIIWDFSLRRMALSKHGHNIELHGIQNSTSSHPVSLNAIYKFIENDVQLQILLAEFSAIFEKPKGLPSSCNCDHRIPLEPSTKPIVLRPYKYPYAQKDEIERQCYEVL